MNNNDFSNEQNAQFVLSYELLHLIDWLVEHDADKLKKIISQAAASGLREKIQSIDNPSKLAITDDMYHSIIDFFELLENLFTDATNEHIAQKAKEKNLMPAIDQIDSSICDDATVRLSVEKATSKLENNPNANVKEQLFKELLKRWKPHNKNVMN